MTRDFSPRCLHCGYRCEYSRGLCKPCFSVPAVRDQYPLRCHGPGEAPPPVPGNPGSDDKLDALAARAARELPLFERGERAAHGGGGRRSELLYRHPPKQGAAGATDPV